MRNAEKMGSVRKGVLERATCSADRVGTLGLYARGKRTLNVGCTGARPSTGASGEALGRHARIARAASSCVGIDLDAEGVADLQRSGFASIVADACTCSLGQEFEVITAGEIIEHVSDGGQFLTNMRRHLEPEGLLVLSTCNPFGAKRFWKILRYGHPCVHPEHTCWYDPVTLMGLAMRCGLIPLELIWIKEPTGLDLRVLPRFLRRYFSSGFVLVLGRERGHSTFSRRVMSGGPEEGEFYPGAVQSP
jgi:SAM-dependent methyltransferase